MNKFIKTVKEEDVCFEFLRVMNGIMGLTNRELDVFSALVALRIRDMKDKRLSRLSVDRTSNRKEIMSKLGVTKDNMSKYIGIFKENYLIYRSREGQTKILDSLIPDIIGGKVVQTTILIKIQ